MDEGDRRMREFRRDVGMREGWRNEGWEAGTE